MQGSELRQVEALQRELDELKQHCEAMLQSVQSLYGPEDHRTLRAQELCNDLERLRWALNRGNSASPVVSPKARDGVKGPR